MPRLWCEICKTGYEEPIMDTGVPFVSGLFPQQKSSITYIEWVPQIQKQSTPRLWKNRPKIMPAHRY